MACILDEVIKMMDEIDPTVSSDYFGDKATYNEIISLDNRGQMRYLNSMFQTRFKPCPQKEWLKSFKEMILPYLV